MTFFSDVEILLALRDQIPPCGSDSLIFGMLALYMLKYPLKCAAARTAGAHLSLNILPGDSKLLGELL